MAIQAWNLVLGQFFNVQIDKIIHLVLNFQKEFLSHFCLSLQQEETRSPRFKYQVYLVNYELCE